MIYANNYVSRAGFKFINLKCDCGLSLGVETQPMLVSGSKQEVGRTCVCAQVLRVTWAPLQVPACCGATGLFDSRVFLSRIRISVGECLYSLGVV